MGSQRSSANPRAVGAPAGNSDPELAALIEEMSEELGVVAERAPWSERDEMAVTQVDPQRGHDPRSRHWFVRER